jgi:hypothetical protein
VEPLFLEGIHAVESGNLDGVVVFVWSDLLKKRLYTKTGPGLMRCKRPLTGVEIGLAISDLPGYCCVAGIAAFYIQALVIRQFG